MIVPAVETDVEKAPVLDVVEGCVLIAAVDTFMTLVTEGVAAELTVGA